VGQEQLNTVNVPSECSSMERCPDKSRQQFFFKIISSGSFLLYLFKFWSHFRYNSIIFYYLLSRTVTNLPLESLQVTIFDPMASNKRVAQVSWSLTLQGR